MQLRVNGVERTFDLGEPPTVARLLALLEANRAPCAVELNRSVVPGARHADAVLHEGDEIEIVTLVGGG